MQALLFEASCTAVFILQGRLPAVVFGLFLFQKLNKCLEVHEEDNRLWVFFWIKLSVVLCRGWNYSLMATCRMYLHRVTFTLRLCAIYFYRLGNVKDRSPVSLKLTPSWLLTAASQLAKDEARRSSFLLSRLWKANFVLTWRFPWKNLQEQARRPALLCWRSTESFWSVRSETRSVWSTTCFTMSTSPLRTPRLLFSFQLKQIRYCFHFTSQLALSVTFNFTVGFYELDVFPSLCYFGDSPPHSFWTSISTTSLSSPAGTARKPAGSCQNEQVGNCCSVSPAAALSSDKEVATVAVSAACCTRAFIII